MERIGKNGIRKADEEWSGSDTIGRRGEAIRGKQRQTWMGSERSVEAWQTRRGREWTGLEWTGQADREWTGSEWTGQAA